MTEIKQKDLEIAKLRGALEETHDAWTAETEKRLEALTEIGQLRGDNERLQARIDALMLEHCPNEMTPEQLAKHQNPHLEPAAAFISGARWARMAQDKAFDDALLNQDAAYYEKTGGNIPVRGAGGLCHMERGMANHTADLNAPCHVDPTGTTREPPHCPTCSCVWIAGRD